MELSEKKNLINLKVLVKNRETVPATILILMVIIFSFLSGGRYLSIFNIIAVSQQASLEGIVAAGMTLILISGEIDISVGSNYALTPVVVALLVKEVGLTIWLAAMIGMGVALLIGFINGYVVTKLKISSFIVTLAMMMFLRGYALILTHARDVGFLPPSVFYQILGGRIHTKFPVMVIWFILTILFLWILLEKTPFGNRIFATGCNQEGARKVGINTDKVKIKIFMIVSACAGFSGIISLSYLSQASPVQGNLLPLYAIAAVVIGGTSFSGGSGTVIGTLVGAFIAQGAINGVVLMGATSYWPQIFMGAMVILATILTTWMDKLRFRID